MSRRTTVFACLVTSTLLTLVAATPASAATGYARTDYVALGDSYSAGVGAPGQSGLCLRGSNGYPALWARRNHPASFENLACVGATTDDVLQSQLPFVAATTDLLTITIGGNDAGFAPTIISCTISSDAACASLMATTHDFVTNVMPGRLDATYRAIKQRAPDARVVVLSYPVLFDTTSANCGIGGMSVAKRRMLNASSQQLHELIKDRVRAAGFTFADVQGDFAGHGVCGASPWINGITVVPVTNSFHPNSSGYRNGYLPALSAALAAAG
jgi:lysophospholipase L1-like esterase